MSVSSVQSLTQSLALLTSREREVKHLLVKGLANKVIAAELGISQRTIETHRASIFRKLEVRNVVELVNYLLLPVVTAPVIAEPVAKLNSETDESEEAQVLLCITDLNKEKTSD